MSNYTGTVPTTSQSPLFSYQRLIRNAATLLITDVPTITTYYYRQTNNSRGSTTSTSSIPSGAVILYTETT